MLPEKDSLCYEGNSVGQWWEETWHWTYETLRIEPSEQNRMMG